jgi:hypothetical protein
MSLCGRAGKASWIRPDRHGRCPGIWPLAPLPRSPKPTAPKAADCLQLETIPTGIVCWTVSVRVATRKSEQSRKAPPTQTRILAKSYQAHLTQWRTDPQPHTHAVDPAYGGPVSRLGRQRAWGRLYSFSTLARLVADAPPPLPWAVHVRTVDGRCDWCAHDWPCGFEQQAEQERWRQAQLCTCGHPRRPPLPESTVGDACTAVSLAGVRPGKFSTCPAARGGIMGDGGSHV